MKRASPPGQCTRLHDAGSGGRRIAVENEQGQTITPGEALGRFLSYAGAWLSRLPDLFQAMTALMP